MLPRLENLVHRIGDDHFAFPPANQKVLDSAESRGVPVELLSFYALCDGAFICQGNDFIAPDSNSYRLKIPHLSELRTTQSCGYIFSDSPLYGRSGNWWQIIDYGDSNWLAFEELSNSKSHIIDVFHETAGEPGSHEVVAISLVDLLNRLLDKNGIYWLHQGFTPIDSI